MTLAEIKKAHNENYALLVVSVGKPEHAEYVKEERRLYKAEIAEQKRLGVYAY